MRAMASYRATLIMLASLVRFNGQKSYMLAGTVVPGRSNLARQGRELRQRMFCYPPGREVADGDNHTIPENTHIIEI